MRPKETYTRKEYEELKDEISNLKKIVYSLNRELITAKQENKQKDCTIKILKDMQKHNNSSEVISTLEKYYRESRADNYSTKKYYKDIADMINLGITDINTIANTINKSYSTVRRALIDMDMWPIPQKDFSSVRLKI